MPLKPQFLDAYLNIIDFIEDVDGASVGDLANSEKFGSRVTCRERVMEMVDADVLSGTGSQPTSYLVNNRRPVEDMVEQYHERKREEEMLEEQAALDAWEDEQKAKHAAVTDSTEEAQADHSDLEWADGVSMDVVSLLKNRITSFEGEIAQLVNVALLEYLEGFRGVQADSDACVKELESDLEQVQGQLVERDAKIAELEGQLAAIRAVLAGDAPQQPAEAPQSVEDDEPEPTPPAPAPTRPERAEKAAAKADPYTVGTKAPKSFSVEQRTGNTIQVGEKLDTYSPDVVVFTVDSIATEWSRTGSDKVIKKHPFLEWFHGNAKGPWTFTNYEFHGGGEMGGESWSTPAQLIVRDQADVELLVSAGLFGERVADKYQSSRTVGHISLEVFEPRLREEENRLKAQARKGVLSKKRKDCPKPKRAVYRDDKLIAELAQSEWAGINLPPMARMAENNSHNTERAHPLHPRRQIRAQLRSRSPSYCNFMDKNPLLDMLWNDPQYGDDWIITAPELGTGGYGPTTIEDAMVWFPDADKAVMFKMLMPKQGK